MIMESDHDLALQLDFRNNSNCNWEAVCINEPMRQLQTAA